MRTHAFLVVLLLVATSSAAATRTVDITMSDTMRFDPAGITVKRGETIRFVAKNAGNLQHEMVLGTRKELEDHAKHMREHPGMEHHEPNMLKVAPGKTGELTWRFTRAGTFYYGCLEPGHFEAGMVGTVIVK